MSGRAYLYIDEPNLNSQETGKAKKGNKMYNYENMLNRKLSHERHDHLLEEARIQAQVKSNNKRGRKRKRLLKHTKYFTIPLA